MNGYMISLAIASMLPAISSQDAFGAERRDDTSSWSSAVVPCGNPVTYEADPGSVELILSRAASCSVVDLVPGDYTTISPRNRKGVTIRCIAPAVVNDTPNPYGCNVEGIISVRIGALIIEDLIFNGTAIALGGSDDYGISMFFDENVMIRNNVFNGVYHHDLSTKENVGYAEITGNRFITCERHCIEVGQNGNVASRPQQSGTMIVSGNIFETPVINAITQRSNSTLIIDNNTFQNVGGHAVQTWPFWKEYDYGQAQGPEKLLIPAGPLRTEVTNNKFIEESKMRFEGRGIHDDVVLVRGNSGIVSCERTEMAEGTAAAHAYVETTAPPKLDPGSDVPC